MSDLLRIEYVPLSRVARWRKNPKLHDIGALVSSIERYGFVDPPKYDPNLNNGEGGLVYGNGRDEALEWMKAQGRPVPRGIKHDKATGEWLMPIKYGVDAPSEQEAEALALDHNNTVLAGGDFTALDMSRMWGPEYTDVLADLAKWDVFPLTVDGDDLDLLLHTEETQAGNGGDDFDTTPSDGPTRTALGDLWVIGGVHRLLVGDCTDPANVERLMQGERAITTALITDPPYGYNLTEWDKPIDVPTWTELWLSLPSSFYAVFGQMPTIHDWHCAALDQKAHFCEHIVWVKRITTPMHRLNRSHESIYVYALGERKMFYQTTGRFEDVKLPGVLVDTVSLEGIDRHVKDLRRKTQGLSTGIHRTGGANRFGSDGKKLGSGIETDRSPEFANYTNVWSFLPPTQSIRDGIDDQDHQTGKPVELVERLVEMLTPVAGTLVVDPFLGSGTTIIAAHRTGRSCYGCEVSPRIADTVLKRAEAEGLTCSLAEGLTCERVVE